MAWIKKRKTAAGEARYDVGYRAPDGKVHRKTFRRLDDAKAYRRTVESEMDRGGWIDPNAGKITLLEYSTAWLKARPELSPRTRELYEGQLRLHILPTLGGSQLNRITPAMVREWRASLYDRKQRVGKARRAVGPNTIAKCYRLLHTIFATAVADELVRRNPCAIEGAGKEQYKERTVASVVQVFELADHVKPERRVLVLLAGFTGLRLGELLALRRRHVDLLHKRLIVQDSTVELTNGALVTKGPKSDAGRRKVHLDRVVIQVVTEHLDDHVGPSAEAYLFTGEKGSQLRRAVWHREWDAARRAVGLQHLHFHDLRHTHGTLVTQLGATIRETMRRLGQSTIQAAMIYQHAGDERDSEIADMLGTRIVAELRKACTTEESERPDSLDGQQGSA